MIVKLLTEHQLEFLSFKGGCKGSSESTHVKMLEITCRGSLLFDFAQIASSLLKAKEMSIYITEASIKICFKS